MWTTLLFLAGCPRPDSHSADKDSTRTDSTDTGVDSGDTGDSDPDTDDSRETAETGDTNETGDSAWDTAPEDCDRSLPWKSVEAGRFLTCGIHTDGCAECWGIGKEDADGYYLYLGEDKPPAGEYASIRLVNSYGGDINAAVGACGLWEDGTAVCWYWDRWRDPGPYQAVAMANATLFTIDDAGEISSPDDAGLPTAGDFAALAVGEYIGLAIESGGSLRGWFARSSIPEEEQFFGGEWTDVSAGAGACAIDSGGAVRCWDDDWLDSTVGGWYFLDDVPDTPATDVCVTGRYTACILDLDGHPSCWGDWPALVDATPTTATFTQISCGYIHACGVTPEGEIQCWGTNMYGEGDPPS